MSQNLVIVESPAKAKTIEGYLGKGYKVMSSYGHVRDLPKGNNAIDIENGFIPTYEVTKDKKDVIRDLKKMVKTSDMVYLASDDDREGEAIAWHLKEALKLKDENTKRIVFHEITKNAIQKAIENPKGIDTNLVDAQQARRVLDRLVGFELSPILWKKIKTGLSAGRVQSVSVRLVVDREREIGNFKATSSFKITALFDLEKGKTLQAELPKKFATELEANEFLQGCVGAEFSIKDLQKKPAKKSPAAPFTTSTLQQEASRKLGYPVGMTMNVAQKLYEAGKISYMRTDSLNLSDEAIAAAKQEIESSYGSEFVKTRKYKTKNASAQEAHEAIRPTNFANHTAGKDDKERRLYDLIWKRSIASQMAEAQLEKTVAKINISTREEDLHAHGEVIVFEGFLKVYLESTDDEHEDETQKGMLPPLTVGQELGLREMKAREGFSRHAARYTEASLVKKLEELGIGRPSTYAPTISTIQKRNYVTKEPREGVERAYKEIILAKDTVVVHDKTEITGAEKNKLFPTNIAMVVNDFLVAHFPKVTDFSFTAQVEKEFDEIAQGQKQWNKMIEEFYTGFHERVEKTEKLERSEVGSQRDLGNHPDTGLPIIARLGRYGAMVQMGETSDEEGADKPKFASLRKGQFLEKITLEEAIDLFKLPRQTGEFEDKVMTAAIGRFGPYVRHDGKFVSIPKDMDPLEITKEQSIELILAKRKSDAEKHIKSFDENPDVQVLNGRWGPYIKFEKKNVKIPKDKEPIELTYAECVELADKTPDKKGRGGKKAVAKKTTTKKAAAKPKAKAKKVSKAKKK